MKKIFILAVLFTTALPIFSCEKYEDGRPKKEVRDSFTKANPDAFDVEWEWEGRYWDVSYETGTRPNGTEHESWYDKEGNWIRTSTEVLISDVPKQIKDYLTADPKYGHGNYTDNDAEYIQTPSGNFYRFELRVDGVDVKVDVSPDGTVSFAKYDF